MLRVHCSVGRVLVTWTPNARIFSCSSLSPLHQEPTAALAFPLGSSSSVGVHEGRKILNYPTIFHIPLHWVTFEVRTIVPGLKASLLFSFSFSFSSFCNEREARLVVEIIKMVKAKISRAHNIGIITPYNAQKRKITKELETELRTDR